MGGRKRKPDHLKVVSGTAQPCRMNPEAPPANPGVAIAPAWLSARAAEIFAQLSAIIDGMGIASPDDVDMLALLASRLEEIEHLTIVIEDMGRTYVASKSKKNGDSDEAEIMVRARPEVAMRNEAMRHAQSLLAEFGLSPAARSKVSANKKDGENPFAALFK